MKSNIQILEDLYKQINNMSDKQLYNYMHDHSKSFIQLEKEILREKIKLNRLKNNK